jgi:hypothetical protein
MDAPEPSRGCRCSPTSLQTARSLALPILGPTQSSSADPSACSKASMAAVGIVPSCHYATATATMRFAPTLVTRGGPRWWLWVRFLRHLLGSQHTLLADDIKVVVVQGNTLRARHSRPEGRATVFQDHSHPWSFRTFDCLLKSMFC